MAHVDGVNGEDPGSDDTKTDSLALGLVNEPTTEFYGESSSIMFTRRLLEAMSLDLTAKRTKTKSPCNETGSVECNIAPVSQQRSVMVSPKDQPSSPATFFSETEMDSLLDIYFNDYGSLFPFLHEPTFRDTYNEYKASGCVKAQRGWLGVLTMTFAMATHINQNGKVSAKHPFRGSHVLFQRAVSLCSELSVRTVSLDIVHYLLLAVLYLLRHTDACSDVDNTWDARTNSDGVRSALKASSTGASPHTARNPPTYLAHDLLFRQNPERHVGTPTGYSRRVYRGEVAIALGNNDGNNHKSFE